MNEPLLNFEDYKTKCYEETLSVQDKFMALYEINDYENWFYDHAINVFTFKANDGRNLYFRYIDLGSFSTKNNTWNWSWDNQTTTYNVKRGLEKVKAFGEINGFEQLTTGLINGDEYTGWEMTAITSKILNAIGMYRIPQEHLFIYFVFTNELTEEQFNTLKERKIECRNHESGLMSFVCQHLLKNDKVGFHEAFESDPLIEPDDDYQAWCDECEIERLKEEGWNEKSMAFANIEIVCDQCYFEIKKRNSLG